MKAVPPGRFFFHSRRILIAGYLIAAAAVRCYM
jgi:hypothetical protein